MSSKDNSNGIFGERLNGQVSFRVDEERVVVDSGDVLVGGPSFFEDFKEEISHERILTMFGVCVKVKLLDEGFVVSDLFDREVVFIMKS